jgi:hypothetical protein
MGTSEGGLGLRKSCEAPGSWRGKIFQRIALCGSHILFSSAQSLFSACFVFVFGLPCSACLSFNPHQCPSSSASQAAAQPLVAPKATLPHTAGSGAGRRRRPFFPLFPRPAHGHPPSPRRSSPPPQSSSFLFPSVHHLQLVLPLPPDLHSLSDRLISPLASLSSAVRTRPKRKARKWVPRKTPWLKRSFWADRETA